MQIDDNDIYTSMRRNPESGIRMVMQKYGEPVYWHARRLLVSHDDAQDAVQETFCRFYQAMERVIYRIATNEALRIIGQNKTPRLLTESIDDSATDIAAADNTDYTDLEAVKLQKAILSLPPKQQATFNMRYYDEMEYQQIAEAMETTVSTVKVNYHLAKEKIIKYMNSND